MLSRKCPCQIHEIKGDTLQICSMTRSSWIANLYKFQVENDVQNIGITVAAWLNNDWTTTQSWFFFGAESNMWYLCRESFSHIGWERTVWRNGGMTLLEVPPWKYLVTYLITGLINATVDWLIYFDLKPAIRSFSKAPMDSGFQSPPACSVSRMSRPIPEKNMGSNACFQTLMLFWIYCKEDDSPKIGTWPFGAKSGDNFHWSFLMLHRRERVLEISRVDVM